MSPNTSKAIPTRSFNLIIAVFCLFAVSAVNADEVDIPQGGSIQEERAFGGIGMRVDEVTIEVGGEDADLVSVEVDDFQQVDRVVTVLYTISVSEEAEVNDQLSVVLTFVLRIGGGSVSSSVQYTINVLEPPLEADFTGEPRSGIAPLRVNFTDLSSGNIAHWLWEFGDDQTSDSTNPTHIYEEPGRYTVSLTITSPGDEEDTRRYPNYISVLMPPPTIEISADSLDFGDVAIGSADTLILTISNTGDGDLIALARIYERCFRVDNLSEFTVQPDSSLDLSVAFAPNETGELTGHLIIYSNDPENVEIHVYLRGNGYEDNTVENNQSGIVPEVCYLASPYPNPFNSTVSITYHIHRLMHISLGIYDLSGHRLSVLFEGNRQPGIYVTEFTAAGLPSGLYIVRLETQRQILNRKALLVR